MHLIFKESDSYRPTIVVIST